jgi:hypothetical protein
MMPWMGPPMMLPLASWAAIGASPSARRSATRPLRSGS